MAKPQTPMASQASQDANAEPSNVGSQPDGATSTPGEVEIGGREERIRRAAYAASERRGFLPGFEEEDWLAAERDFDAGRGEPEGRVEDQQDLSGTVIGVFIPAHNEEARLSRRHGDRGSV